MRLGNPHPLKSVDRQSRAHVHLRWRGSAVALALPLLAVGMWLALTGNSERAGGVQDNATTAIGAIASAERRLGDRPREFVSSILGDTEDVWREQFRRMKQTYKEPRLVLFRGQIQSACGKVKLAFGPTYCPGDEKIYLDLGFFTELKDRYHTEADFARAYVIAHEVGHHIQKLLEIPGKALAKLPELSKEEKEQAAIRLELQADYLAGVWAHHADKARHILEPGDVEAAVGLLATIGDDRLELDGSGDLGARSMTRCWDRRHGSGTQKIQSFKKGLETGDLTQVDSIHSAK